MHRHHQCQNIHAGWGHIAIVANACGKDCSRALYPTMDCNGAMVYSSILPSLSVAVLHAETGV